jgi:hypothetical protein
MTGYFRRIPFLSPALPCMMKTRSAQLCPDTKRTVSALQGVVVWKDPMIVHSIPRGGSLVTQQLVDSSSCMKVCRDFTMLLV